MDINNYSDEVIKKVFNQLLSDEENKKLNFIIDELNKINKMNFNYKNKVCDNIISFLNYDVFKIYNIEKINLSIHFIGFRNTEIDKIEEIKILLNTFNNNLKIVNDVLEIKEIKISF